MKNGRHNTRAVLLQ